MIRPHPPSLLGLTLLGCAGCAAAPDGYDRRATAWDHAREERTAARASVELPPDAGLPELLRHARAHNPGLEAAFQRWKAALERVPQATALPEPRLTFGVYLAEVETRVGPMEGRVGVTQPIPWFGKLDLAGDVAFERAEVAREMLAATRLELDERVREAWYEYTWLEQAVEITAGNLDLLAHWESVARARMETGLGPHADVIRAQVELGRLQDRLQTLTDLRRPIRARLNAALDRPPDAPLPTPAPPLPPPPELDGERLAADLGATSPHLAALQHRIDAAEHDVDLADKAFYPDLALGADYTLIGSAEAPGVPGSGDDALALTLGIELPLWRSAYRAGASEAESRLRSARLERSESWNRLSAELQMALYRFRDAHRRVGLFRDTLVPKGEESVQALDTAYQAGDVGFLDLVDAQRVLLDFQLEAARAESDRAQALAAIERITGIPLVPEN